MLYARAELLADVGLCTHNTAADPETAARPAADQLIGPCKFPALLGTIVERIHFSRAVFIDGSRPLLATS
jgi:hypothetical protein